MAACKHFLELREEYLKDVDNSKKLIEILRQLVEQWFLSGNQLTDGKALFTIKGSFNPYTIKKVFNDAGYHIVDLERLLSRTIVTVYNTLP